jgi:S-layer protein
VTADHATVDATVAAIDSGTIGGLNQGQTFTLTAGLDTPTGTTGNDTFNAPFATALGALDSINGGAGADVLNVFGVDALGAVAAIGVTTATVANVEVANFTGGTTVTVDTSDWTGLTALNVLSSPGAADVTAAATTAVSVANAGGSVTVVGGSTQTVAVGTAAGAIDLSGAADAVVLTVAKQGANTIEIDDGTSVTVTSSAQTTATSGTITIGATDEPTGAVSVTSNLSNAKAAATNMAGGLITVNGGSTVTVTQTATQAVMTTASTNSTVTQSDVVVNGGAATTAVTSTQTAAVAAVDTIVAAAAVTESASVVFAALTAGQTLTIGGLTFTATGAVTAAQAAAAFANLTDGAIQGSSALGVYSGAFTGWATGAASGTGSTTVVFSSTVAGDVTDLANTGTGAVTSTTVTQGVAAATAKGTGGIANGVVSITDAGYATTTADTITSATVNGYAAGSSVSSDALASLALANSSGNFDVFNNTATTLGLAVNNVQDAVSIDAAAAKYTSLFIAATGEDSAFALTAAAVTALDVSGDVALDLSGSTLTALKTVAVSGAAGLTLDASGAAVTAVNASGTTGDNFISVDGSKATYTGGSGVDELVLTSATVSKAIALGAGDDFVELAAGTTAITGSIDGGDGTNDTIIMVGADATTASATAIFETKISGFERVGVLLSATTDVIDLANMDDISSVITEGAADLTINNMGNGGTLEIAGASTLVNVNVTDAALVANTTDSLNVIVAGETDIAAGTVNAAGVETIALTVTDSKTPFNAVHSLTLMDAALKTVSVTGNADLVLTLDANVVKLTSLDGSAMTGNLTATTNGTVAQTITGGAGDDMLTAKAGTKADVLIGGAGSDTLTANAGLNTLTGGADADVFVIQSASANVNTYATITDASAGDTISLVDMGTEVFNRTKLSLGDTAVFQDYANLAAASLTGASTGVISWFQFGGNTYVVEDLSNLASFENGVDLVVKLTGLVDLSTASISDTATLLIV